MPAVLTRPAPGRASDHTLRSEHATPKRDATIDAVRAACLLAVVLLHSLMVGVQVGPGGSLHTSVALSGESWFAPITWILQIMPLFFIAGGFASLTQWRSMRAKHASAADYVLSRVRRLAVPAAIMIFAVGAVLLGAVALGADTALIAEASLRIGQPLWFLAVYLGVTALVPAMVWLHERVPMLTIGALGAGVITMDLLHSQAGIPVGYLNLMLVWPLMQQLGFALADGACANWSKRALVFGAMLPIAGLLGLLGLGWSPDMIANLNPPTIAIALLGTAQFFLLQLFRGALDRLTAQPRIAHAAQRAGSIAMTVYLWHMPLILALVAVMWWAGLPLPEPHSLSWWATRLPWIIVIAELVFPFASWFVKIEQVAVRTVGTGRTVSRGSQRLRALASVPFAALGVAIALLGGIATSGMWLASLASLGIGIAFAVPGTFAALWARAAELPALDIGALRDLRFMRGIDLTVPRWALSS
ncbi:acyltransferase [Leucobacter sp. UT-8R-CII-1-4]|uniref:acyltransferase family protein n=1 Tax=Leucobacter sp. UT-8R-CII-1-4 TaxID=3040075 RepID=UPI0024A9F96B|nr:acyltransferase [Leucobacter sp. UT-8R-CII-1-4]MDI6022395.1 acyltransferase [Leucobacter sp. UT-8R-CII-1-4]